MCISFLKRFISFLPKNRIFTTREVLIFGSRSAIDQALRRLVKAEWIVRLARGVFIKTGSKHPTAMEVAQAKYRAYGKQIAKYGADLARELKLIDNPNQQMVFTTGGHSSQFWFGNILIKIKGVSHRKMQLCKHKTGRAMAALWYLGKELCEQQQITKAVEHLSRIDRQQLRESRLLLPEWIGGFYTNLLCPKNLIDLKLSYDHILNALEQNCL